MNRTISTFASIAAAALIAGSSSAETVAWWHFDEQEPGMTASSGVVTESVSDSKATAYSINASTPNETGSYRPTFTRPFPGLAVYDPVMGVTNSNHSAMKFRIARGGTNPTTDAGRAYYGGALVTSGCDLLYANCKVAITIEAFVCTTGGVYNTFAPIVGCVNNGDFVNEPWALYMRDDGTVVVRHNSTAYYQNDNKGQVKINDGLWHHVAWTWDGSNIRVYVDYKLDKKGSSGDDRIYAKDGNFSYTEGKCATWIGGYTNFSSTSGGRKFPGIIDEVRISNVALTPDKFLRLVPTSADDADTVLHLRFDADAPYAFAESEIAGGMFDRQLVYHSVAGAGCSSLDTANKAGETMFDGVFAEGVADTASFGQTTNAAGKANYFEVPKATSLVWPDGCDASASNHNYTIEAFFRTRGSSPVRQNIVKFGTDGHLPAQFITGDASHSHQVDFIYNANGSWKNFQTPVDKPVDDGQWHHLAFVSDASNRLMRAYLDYELFNTIESVYDKVEKDYPLVIGAKENASGQFFDGWIDDVRITKRALRPNEFLTTHSVGPASPNSLLLAKFEQSYDLVCEADDAFSVVGMGEARTGGAAPTFAKTSPGALILDGANGSEWVENEYSVHLNKSRVVFPISRLYETDAYTVEFWAKFTGFDGDRAPDYSASGQHAGILRFVQGGTTTPDWYLYRPGDQTKQLQISVRHADGTTSSYLHWDMPNIVADGRWHHYALTFKPTDGDAKTAVEIFYDCNSLGINTVNARMNVCPVGHRLMLGESSTDAMPNILGYVNALRFSRGVLTPDKFIGRVKPGAIIFIR